VSVQYNGHNTFRVGLVAEVTVALLDEYRQALAEALDAVMRWSGVQSRGPITRTINGDALGKSRNCRV
jgi:hypothetical protein